MKKDSQQIQECEELLLQRHTRKDIDALSRLLHDDFEELGKSGEFCHKQQAIEWLVRENDNIVWSLTDFKVRFLTNDVALASYCAQKLDLGSNKTRLSMRTSIWQKVKNNWTLRYHQASPCEPS